MSSWLEHSDHRKAGRAVVIVSTMYILLDQCTVPFNRISLLNLDVSVTSAELNLLLYSILLIYLAIYVFRIYQSGIFFSFLEIQTENETERRRLHQLFTDRHNQVAQETRAWKQTLFNATPQDNPKRETLLDDAAKTEKRRVRISGAQMKMGHRAARIYYSSRNWLDFTLLTVIEFFIPTLFAYVALGVPIAWKVCPSFATYQGLLAIIP